jgi:predicted outer membrane repeat protein
MDTINFALNSFCRLIQCTAQLASPLPTVSQDVTINGEYDVQISGEDLYAVFDFGSATVNVANLAVVNALGNFGGGITMNGTTLTLNNVRVAGNHAHAGSGLYELSGTLYVFNSHFIDNIAEASGFGGAIGQNGGAAIISNTSFSGNTGGSGGAIASLFVSNLQVTASDFDGNTANVWGGAIYLQDDTVEANIAGSSFTNNQTLTTTAVYGGGAIWLTHGGLTLADDTLANNIAGGPGGALDVHGGQVTLTNVTVSGNTAKDSGGGVYVTSDGINNPAIVTLNNVTINGNLADSDNNNTGDGGGLFTSHAAVNLLNSIVAGNFDTPSNTGAGTINPDCSGTFASPQYSLIGRNDGCGGVTNGSNGNLVGTAGSPIDPRLAPLADNGGPTLTQALLGDSPALNAGNPATPGSGGTACAATDQRGLHRPFGSHCDMGAFERGYWLYVALIKR